VSPRRNLPAPVEAVTFDFFNTLVFHREGCFDVYPDVTEALRTLQARDVPLAIVSNWQSGLRHFCSELQLSPYFEQVLCSGDLGFEKPDERIFLEACTRLGVAPERTLHVGDTYLDDYMGGQAAGLQVLLLAREGNAPAGVRSVVSLADVLERVKPRTSSESIDT
jgi:putative hydrolase of the HAD superfamily